MEKRIRYTIRVAMILWVLWCMYKTVVFVITAAPVNLYTVSMGMVGALGWFAVLCGLVYLIGNALEWIWFKK
jgi:hypothetical protein